MGPGTVRLVKNFGRGFVTEVSIKIGCCQPEPTAPLSITGVAPPKLFCTHEVEMRVGCSRQEMVVGHAAAGWQNTNSTTPPETRTEKFHFQKHHQLLGKMQMLNKSSGRGEVNEKFWWGK